jgi:hypothetical protein
MAGFKPEFPPLLDFGFHPMTIQELHQLAVAPFSKSNTRADLWTNFLWLISELQAAGLKGRIWVDGSFVTEKIDPDDIDMIFEGSYDFLQALQPSASKLVQILSNQQFKLDKKLHTFVIYSAPMGHVRYPQAKALQDTWIRNWGYSLKNRTPKGIVTVSV